MIALIGVATLLLAPPWKPVAAGVDVAPAAELGADPAWAARVILVDPGRAQFLVRYDPGRPSLAEWQKRFPKALAIVNGSFYSLQGNEVRPTCELVADGKRFRGAGCLRQDALFFAAAARPGAAAAGVLLSRERPAPPKLLAPSEFKPDDWTEALKSFPALVRAGVPACAGPHYCSESSRTAAVAQLKDGRILLFASQWPAVRREVAKWLSEQAGAVDALNLDGGPEATLAVAGEPAEDAIATPGVGLPIVLIVMAR